MKKKLQENSVGLLRNIWEDFTVEENKNSLTLNSIVFTYREKNVFAYWINWKYKTEYRLIKPFKEEKWKMFLSRTKSKGWRKGKRKMESVIIYYHRTMNMFLHMFWLVQFMNHMWELSSHWQGFWWTLKLVREKRNLKKISGRNFNRIDFPPFFDSLTNWR